MSTAHHDPLPAEVIAAVQRGEKIEAIKILRERTGIGLKDAKDAVEAWAEGHVTELHGAAPSGGGSRVLQFVVIAIALAAAVYFFFPTLRN